MSDNPSGVEPLLNRILVKPDDIEEKTSGGIYIPEPVKEQHQQAQATGILIAIGPDAYVESRLEIHRLIDGEMKLVELRVDRYDDRHTPQVGDRVVFAKFGGLPVKGEDGKEYRMLNDRDITAKASSDVSYTGIESRKPISEAVHTS